MLNCSSATPHGSRWVWSMTAADVFMSPSRSSWHGRFELLGHDPIIVRPAGSVRAVPVLDDDPPETLCEEGVSPGAETPRHERSETHVLARREHALEVSPPLEQRHGQKGFAVDLKQVESGEDLPPAELPGVRVALVVDF